MDEYKSTIERLCANNQAEQERELQATIDRLCADRSGGQATINWLTGGSRAPGYGPGRYTPQAKATNKDTVALFVPQSAFDGTWQGFQQARDKAIDWIRSNRSSVENGGTLCWGPAFELDSSPLSYRDSDGTNWFNCGITEETDFWQARVGVS